MALRMVTVEPMIYLQLLNCDALTAHLSDGKLLNNPD